MFGKAINLALIVAAQVLALWFSGTAAGPAMAREFVVLASGFQALLTGAVQGGFVIGTLVSAALALADRFDPRRLFAAAALAGAAANAAILLLSPGTPIIAARFATGMALAGVYPVGMKLAVGWANRGDAGLEARCRDVPRAKPRQPDQASGGDRSERRGRQCHAPFQSTQRVG